jgi:hypothetical protein
MGPLQGVAYCVCVKSIIYMPQVTMKRRSSLVAAAVFLAVVLTGTPAGCADSGHVEQKAAQTHDNVDAQA